MIMDASDSSTPAQIDDTATLKACVSQAVSRVLFTFL